MNHQNNYSEIRVRESTPVVVHDQQVDRVQFTLCRLLAAGVRGAVHSITSVSLRDCAVDRCSIDRAVFRNVMVENLSTRSLCETLDCFFEHVTLKGKIGKLNLGVYRSPDPTDKFAPHRDAFYRDVDWALDVTEARFAGLDLHADLIPLHLIRFDPSSQGIVTPASLARAKMQRVREISPYLASRVDVGLHYNPAGALIFVDRAARNWKERQTEFDRLARLGLFAKE